jgi:hypothetical protein
MSFACGINDHLSLRSQSEQCRSFPLLAYPPRHRQPIRIIIGLLHLLEFLAIFDEFIVKIYEIIVDFNGRGDFGGGGGDW